MPRQPVVMAHDAVQELESAGHALLHGAVTPEVLAALRAEAVRLADADPANAHGIRGLLQRSTIIATWARSDSVLGWLPPGLQPVRGILFDKIPGANWKVAWHQDVTITVEEKVDLPGYGPWSVKEGAWHVQPPAAVLEGIVTVRLHLDETPADNGALRVIPASHLHGRLSAEDIARLRETAPEHVCEARAGDILLMKPLLLHASAPSLHAAHRRVVHVEYATPGLLHPALRWRSEDGAPAPP